MVGGGKVDVIDGVEGRGEEGGVQIVTERSWRRVTRRKRGMAQRIVSKIRLWEKRAMLSACCCGFLLVD